MKVRTHRRTGLEIGESATLSDLAFLLIIFFIVIAVFNINKGFLLGLPEPDSTRIVPREELLRVELTASGELRSRGTPLSIEELIQKAESLRRDRPNMTFLLRIDPETPYQRVVDVVDLVRRLDIDNFSFSMMEEEP
ncbi:MAG TPA: biopolymer transporter ExbD [Spirochaetales bacterium]|nr:biopolymer transporter ExbD [Spirochaetales bacterium]HOV37585.1 biopolymer transporter ExbD [Spirochaetales bacterium]